MYIYQQLDWGGEIFAIPVNSSVEPEIRKGGLMGL